MKRIRKWPLAVVLAGSLLGVWLAGVGVNMLLATEVLRAGAFNDHVPRVPLRLRLQAATGAVSEGLGVRQYQRPTPLYPFTDVTAASPPLLLRVCTPGADGLAVYVSLLDKGGLLIIAEHIDSVPSVEVFSWTIGAGEMRPVGHGEVTLIGDYEPGSTVRIEFAVLTSPSRVVEGALQVQVPTTALSLERAAEFEKRIAVARTPDVHQEGWLSQNGR